MNVVEMKFGRNLVSIMLCLAIFLAACGSDKPRSPEEMLEGMSITAEQYATLSTCEQVRIYTDIGGSFIDIGHLAAIVPGWMDDSLGSQDKQALLDCVLIEGKERIRRIDQYNDKYNENYKKESYGLHAVLYLLMYMDLLEYTQSQELFKSAICDVEFLHSYSIIRFYYGYLFGKSPSYLGLSDTQDKMVQEICTDLQ